MTEQERRLEDQAFEVTVCTCKARRSAPHHEQTCAKYAALYRVTRQSLNAPEENDA